MEKPEKTHPHILYLLTAIIIVNLLCTFSVFLYAKNQKKTTEALLTRIAGAVNSPRENSIPTIDINIPLYQYLGDPDAPVELILITDFQCVYCRQLYENIFTDIRKEYINRGLVKLSYLPYPLENIHSGAMYSAQGGAYLQESGDVFWEYFRYMFQMPPDGSQSDSDMTADGPDIRQAVDQFILDKDLDLSAFHSFTKDERNTLDISKTRKILSEKGVSGTPALVINGVLYTGSVNYEELQSILDGELERLTRRISLTEAELLIEEDESLVLDVRTGAEFNRGHLPEAFNMDVLDKAMFLKQIESLDRHTPYLIYCAGGKRSSIAWQLHEGSRFHQPL